MSKLYLIYLIRLYAVQYHVDPLLAQAIVEIESMYDISMTGELGEIGLFQLRPEYFSGRSLRDVRINVKLGVKHLNYMKDNCKHQRKKTYIICYNAGISGGEKIRHPELFPYYKKIMIVYKRLKKDFIKELQHIDDFNKRV